MHSSVKDASKLFPGSDREIAVVLDIQAVLYRYFFADRDNPNSALKGAADIVTTIQTWNPEILAVAYDVPGKTWRHDLYKDYKANRPSRPEKLKQMLPAVWEFLESIGVPTYGQSRYEADDIVAALVDQYFDLDYNAILVSWDKDLACLVRDTPCGRESRVIMYRPKVGAEPESVLDSECVEAKYGVPPQRIREFLALAGDTTDNIPGATRVGPKGAVELLQIYDSWADLMEAAEEIEGIPRKPKKEEGRHFLRRVADSLDITKMSYTLTGFRKPFLRVPVTTNLNTPEAYNILKSAGLFNEAQRILGI